MWFSYHQDRCDGYGGVFVACRDDLATHDVHLTASSCELVACHIQLTDHSSLIACSVYRPPSSNELYLAELCQQLVTIQAQYPNSALCRIAGDINLPDINWVNNCTTGTATMEGGEPSCYQPSIDIPEAEK